MLACDFFSIFVHVVFKFKIQIQKFIHVNTVKLTHVITKIKVPKVQIQTKDAKMLNQYPKTIP